MPPLPHLSHRPKLYATRRRAAASLNATATPNGGSKLKDLLIFDRIWLGCDGLVHVSQPVGRYRAMRLAARANRVERGLIQGYEGEEGPSPAPF